MPSRVALRAAPTLAALLVLLALVTGSSAARAWVELHIGADEVRVAIDRSGHAKVEHKITLKISGGPLRGFDLVGVDDDAAPLPDAYVVPAKDAASLASAIPLTLDLVPAMAAFKDRPAEPAKLRVRFDAPRGLSRGVYTAIVRYATDLAGRGMIDRSARSSLDAKSTLARVSWKGAIWEDGLDTTHATFELPPAPTEPRVDEPAPAAADDLDAPRPVTFLSTVRRSPDKDEIELVRPYAPKGEGVAWSVRVDPRAFGATAPEPVAAPPEQPVVDFGLSTPAGRSVTLGAAMALFLFYALLVAFKFRTFAARAKDAGATSRPFVPMPLALRAAVAGLALVGGVALELVRKDATLGAAVVALAALLSAHKSPRWLRASPLRRPGRWLPIAEEEAFRAPPRLRGAALDVSTRAGKTLFVLALAAVGAAVFAVQRVSAYHAFLVALDATPLLALFGTGRLRDLPPDPAVAPARLLGNVAKRLRRALRGAGGEVRLVPRIHVPNGGADADELRLSVVPRPALAGFVGIEVGVVFAPGSGGPIALPEVLLRLTSGSACEEALARLGRHARASRGKKPGERVFAFTPRLPTARMTAAIAATLARVVLDPSRSVESTRERRAA